MTISAITNISYLSSSRMLSKSITKSNTVLDRLSSGLRINSAKDDAGGIGIATRMSAQIRGYNHALRNANDGLSLAQVAEGALIEVEKSVQKIREIAVRASNGIFSSSDRENLQNEVDQHIANISYLAEHTEFNNIKLLDGTLSNKTFQIGSNASETISLSIDGIDPSQIPVSETSDTDDGDDSVTPENLAQDLVGGNAVSNLSSSTTTTNSGFFTGGIDAGIGIDEGIILSTGNANDWTQTDTGDVVGAGLDTDLGLDGDPLLDTLSGDTTYDAAYLEFDFVPDSNNISIEFVFASEEYLDNVNSGVSDAFGFYVNGVNVALINSSPITIDQINDTTNSQYFIDNTDGTSFNHGFDGFTTPYTITTSVTAGQSNTVRFTIADVGDEIFDSAIFLKTGTLVSDDTSATLDDVSVLTHSQAQDTISVADNSLSAVSDIRANLGSFINRLESVINNLSTAEGNHTSAHSRIVDADIASEQLNLTRSRILQQAGVMNLVHINLQPQIVLKLLR
jgi:flagellin